MPATPRPRSICWPPASMLATSPYLASSGISATRPSTRPKRQRPRPTRPRPSARPLRPMRPEAGRWRHRCRGRAQGRGRGQAGRKQGRGRCGNRRRYRPTWAGYGLRLGRLCGNRRGASAAYPWPASGRYDHGRASVRHRRGRYGRGRIGQHHAQTHPASWPGGASARLRVAGNLRQPGL
jgi:hypothetical protein